MHITCTKKGQPNLHEEDIITTNICTVPFLTCKCTHVYKYIHDCFPVMAHVVRTAANMLVIIA